MPGNTRVSLFDSTGLRRDVRCGAISCTPLREFTQFPLQIVLGVGAASLRLDVLVRRLLVGRVERRSVRRLRANLRLRLHPAAK